eukprot:2100625-Pyramimonas_sp.AAC.1
MCPGSLGRPQTTPSLGRPLPVFFIGFVRGLFAKKCQGCPRWSSPRETCTRPSDAKTQSCYTCGCHDSGHPNNPIIELNRCSKRANMF